MESHETAAAAAANRDSRDRKMYSNIECIEFVIVAFILFIRFQVLKNRRIELRELHTPIFFSVSFVPLVESNEEEMEMKKLLSSPVAPSMSSSQ